MRILTTNRPGHIPERTLRTDFRQDSAVAFRGIVFIAIPVEPVPPCFEWFQSCGWLARILILALTITSIVQPKLSVVMGGP